MKRLIAQLSFDFVSKFTSMGRRFIKQNGLHFIGLIVSIPDICPLSHFNNLNEQFNFVVLLLRFSFKVAS